MTEVLFILTTIFVAYVVYNIVNEKQKASTTVTPVAETIVEIPEVVDTSVTPEPKPEPVIAAVVETAAVIAPAAPKPRQPASKKTTIKPTVIATAAKSGLRDPNTGEVAAVANNYRFMKRWIKEALVTEGLLPKVYKNTELDAPTEALIKDAVAQLENLAKYQA